MEVNKVKQKLVLGLEIFQFRLFMGGGGGGQ